MLLVDTIVVVSKFVSVSVFPIVVVVTVVSFPGPTARNIYPTTNPMMAATTTIPVIATRFEIPLLLLPVLSLQLDKAKC